MITNKSTKRVRHVSESNGSCGTNNRRGISRVRQRSSSTRQSFKSIRFISGNIRQAIGATSTTTETENFLLLFGRDFLLGCVHGGHSSCGRLNGIHV